MESVGAGANRAGRRARPVLKEIVMDVLEIKKKLFARVEEIEDSLGWVRELIAGLEEPAPEEKVLRLEVSVYTGSLRILYGEGIVGYISRDGKCNIRNHPDRRAAIDEWIKIGMPTEHSIVEWRGGKYRLDGLSDLRRTDIEFGAIYSFAGGYPVGGCKDINIIRDSEERPILY